MINTVLVEDNLYVQKVLKTMIESDERFQLTATFTDAFEAEKFCAYGKTDLVLMDVQTQNNHSGLAAGKRIKEASPRTKVVIVTSLVDPDVLKKARNGAADSLWYKDHGTKDIIDVMVRTMNGERVFPESSPSVTLKDIFSEDLTPKQMKILRYFVKGYTYEEIAQELDMTKRNVRWHLDNIVEKSGFENKYELLIALIDSKLIVANLTEEE